MHLRRPIGLLSVRLTSQQITNFIDGNHFRVWNRRYIDYFINVTSGDFENRKHFRDGQHIVDPQASWHLAGLLHPGVESDFPWAQLLHAHATSPQRLQSL